MKIYKYQRFLMRMLPVNIFLSN